MSGDWVQRHEFDLVKLANRDPLAALHRLEELSDRGVSVTAQTALHIALRCLEMKSLPLIKRNGRPPRSLKDQMVRWRDGKTAIENEAAIEAANKAAIKPLSKVRSPREVERCIAEYKKLSPPETPL
jgi:hypothetical protein